MTTTQPGRDYLKRYEDGDEGLRFQPLKYTGNFTDLEPVPDGILGDRRMRERDEDRRAGEGQPRRCAERPVLTGRAQRPE